MRFLLCSLLLLASVAQAEVMELRPEPGTDEKLAAAVQKAMESYNAILKDEMGLELQKSVRIDICSTLECYQQKNYERGLRGAELEKAVRSTGGFANNSIRQINLKLLNASQLKSVNKLVSHELTHFLQSELSDSSTRTPSWLNEGMADFFGALVAQKLGSQSFEKWKLESVNALRRAESYPQPQDLAEINGRNYNEWREFTDKTKGANYLMADLMVAYLYEQKGRKLFGELAEYLRCLSGTFSSETTCFSKNFGVTPEQYHQQVGAWVRAELAKTGGLEIVANDQDAIATEINKAYATAQALLEEKLGRKLDITMRIHLSGNQPEMASQIAVELGLDDSDATKRAKTNSWLWQDSLAFIDTSRVKTIADRADIIGQLVIARHLQLRAGDMTKQYWLYMGLRGWMAWEVMKKQGERTPEQLIATRTKILSGASKGLPTLAELTTPANWNKAVSKYGYYVALQYAMEATYGLLEKSGIQQLGKWIETNKQLKGSPEAFAQAFGEPFDHFMQNYHSAVN